MTFNVKNEIDNSIKTVYSIIEKDGQLGFLFYQEESKAWYWDSTKHYVPVN